LIFVATAAAVSVDRMPGIDSATPPLRPGAVIVIGAVTPPTVLPAPAKPAAPFRLTGALMAMSTWAGVMPDEILMVELLSVKEPLFTMPPGRIWVPVTRASASAVSVAPKPVILATDGEPATGFAENVLGSISSEPGTLMSWADVNG